MFPQKYQNNEKKIGPFLDNWYEKITTKSALLSLTILYCYSNFHMKISLGKFILMLKLHKWILVFEYELKEILAHIPVQICWKVLLLSAGNIQAEIFNRLSRSIRQELTKNAVQKELKT